MLFRLVIVTRPALSYSCPRILPPHFLLPPPSLEFMFFVFVTHSQCFLRCNKDFLSCEFCVRSPNCFCVNCENSKHSLICFKLLFLSGLDEQKKWLTFVFFLTWVRGWAERNSRFLIYSKIYSCCWKL